MGNENILIVDDTLIEVTAFEEELSQEGYQVDTAISGEKAVEMAKQKKYGIVFIDMVMPGMDGIDTCKAIKEISPDTIPIFFTGKVDADTSEKERNFIHEGGEVYYLYKPLDEGMILQAVRKALSGMSNTAAKELIHELNVQKTELKRQTNEINELNELLEQRVAGRTAKLLRTNRELRKAQVQIEASRQEYTDLYDFAPVGYITLDKDGRVLKANLTIGKMLHHWRSMLLNRLFHYQIDRDYQDVFYIHLRKLFEGEEPLTCEVRLCRRNDTKFYAVLDSILVKDPGGNNVCRTSITDITKRKQAEEQLKESRQKYTDLYDFAPTGLLALDDKGVILEANRTVVKMLSIKQPHLLIKSLLHNYIDMAYQDIFYLHLREIFEGKETAVCELVFRNKLHARLDSVIGQHSGSNNICKTSITDITGIEG